MMKIHNPATPFGDRADDARRMTAIRRRVRCSEAVARLMAGHCFGVPRDWMSTSSTTWAGEDRR